MSEIDPNVDGLTDEEVALADKRRKEVRAILDNPLTRKWIWRQLAECGIFRISFVPDNQHKTAFNEGARNVGLRMLSDFKTYAPDLYILMEHENRG